MTKSEAAKALFAKFIVEWPTKVGGTQNAPTIPYALEERPLPQPPPAVFAVVEITDLDSDQVTMGEEGRRKYQHMAFLDVRLYGPRGQGRLQLDTLGEYIVQMFSGKTVGAINELERGVRTYTTSVKAKRDDKEYPDLRCVLARTPFEHYQRR